MGYYRDSVKTKEMDTVELQEPKPWPNANKNLLLGDSGAFIQPEQRLMTFSSDEFENFTQQWAHGYLNEQFCKVERQGGAGDKGRDIIAWKDPVGTPSRKWVNYQCKHYDAPLMPSNIWIEIGKLIYYTYVGDFTLPEKYFFVSPKGCCPSLVDLLNSPAKLKERFISEWDKHCKEKLIAKKSIILDKNLLDYIESVNFCIFESLSVNELIEGHSRTRWHNQVFGGQPIRKRKKISPPSTPSDIELRYVNQMYLAFSDHTKTSVACETDFSSSPALVRTFNKAREGFYSVETLREFAKDQMPSDDFYHDILEQSYVGLTSTVDFPHDNGYARLLKTQEAATSLNLESNELSKVINQTDRVGICHHLVNDKRFSWVEDDD